MDQMDDGRVVLNLPCRMSDVAFVLPFCQNTKLPLTFLGKLDFDKKKAPALISVCLKGLLCRVFFEDISLSLTL